MTEHLSKKDGLKIAREIEGHRDPTVSVALNPKQFAILIERARRNALGELAIETADANATAHGPLRHRITEEI